MTTKTLIPRKHWSKYLYAILGGECELYLLGSCEKRISGEAIFRETQEDKPGYRNPLGSHLTNLSAEVIAQQLIIGHYCREFGETKHNLGEFVGREVGVRMKRGISLDDPVSCEIDITHERNVEDGIFGKYTFSLNCGAFTGHISGIIPTG